jgi:hypothetical protein
MTVLRKYEYDKNGRLSAIETDSTGPLGEHHFIHYNDPIQGWVEVSPEKYKQIKAKNEEEDERLQRELDKVLEEMKEQFEKNFSWHKALTGKEDKSTDNNKTKSDKDAKDTKKENPPKLPNDSSLPKANTVSTIGMVVPARSSGVVSGTITVHPDEYKGIPGIQVFTTSVPLVTGDDGKPSLDQLMVDAGGKLQPANEPVVFQAGDQKVINFLPSGTPGAHVSLPLIFQPRQSAPGAHEITTSPTCFPGSVVAVHGAGRFSGDAGKMLVSVGGTPVTPIAANQDGFFYRVPANVPKSVNDLMFVDVPSSGLLAASAQVAVMTLTTGVAQSVLHKGQKTEGIVGLDADGIPPEAWQGNVAADPDLVDLAELRKRVPDFEPPHAGQPGTILLAILNRSPQTISIADFKGLVKFYSLNQKSLPFKTRLGIRAQGDGGFDIGVIAQAFLAPERCQELH